MDFPPEPPGCRLKDHTKVLISQTEQQLNPQAVLRRSGAGGNFNSAARKNLGRPT